MRLFEEAAKPQESDDGNGFFRAALLGCMLNLALIAAIGLVIGEVIAR